MRTESDLGHLESYETSNTITHQHGAEMDSQELPSDFHPQDWIIIIEALAQWAGPPDDALGRRERAYELIEGISRSEGLPLGELVRQSEFYFPAKFSFDYS